MQLLQTPVASGHSTVHARRKQGEDLIGVGALGALTGARRRQHADLAGGQARDGEEVQVGSLACNHAVHGAGRDELQVGRLIIKLLAPGVDLDAADHRVVCLAWIHRLLDQELHVIVDRSLRNLHPMSLVNIEQDDH